MKKPLPETIKQNKRKILGVVIILILIASGLVIGANFVLNLGSQSLEEARDQPRTTGSDDLGLEGTYQGTERILKRDATIQAITPNFTESFNQIRNTAQFKGGVVTDYDVNRQGDWQEGTVTIEIPSNRFFETRDEIVQSLDEVTREDVQVEDRTGEKISLQAEKQFLEEQKQWLESEESDSYYSYESERREDLREVREEIQQIEFGQNRLEQEGSTSTITVELQEPLPEKPPRDYRTEVTILDSFRNGIHGGVQVVKNGITSLGYIIPLIFFLFIVAILIQLAREAWMYWTYNMYPRVKSSIVRLIQSSNSQENPQEDPQDE